MWRDLFVTAGAVVTGLLLGLIGAVVGGVLFSLVIVGGRVAHVEAFTPSRPLEPQWWFWALGGTIIHGGLNGALVMPTQVATRLARRGHTRFAGFVCMAGCSLAFACSGALTWMVLGASINSTANRAEQNAGLWQAGEFALYWLASGCHIGWGVSLITRRHA